ncbi:VOC family protein [Mycolicibacterium sp. CBMA 226]|uniref:VOC family protein n=1 Tax=Mycolicibacterium sp. CBMA 226 TaxID=2606611 RepID=UPI0012DEA299|nr:VOC family protein [Mycolicibacterium sp. CBMA 226]MUL78917.1 VOC family protein [Mycolicibacterium sp. CBMA 226]QGW61217.1 Catechol-2,3-dioxygenase [Mycolicibacterium sp.]
MTVRRLNHAVLYVRDLSRSIDFYRDILNFDVVMEMGGRAAFLRADGSVNDHDLGLISVDRAGASDAGLSTVGLYHLAWEVDKLRDLQELERRLAAASALVGASDHGTTKSLYAHDPDGLEFEIVWVVPADLLDEAALAGRVRRGPLDIAHEMTRYGADTLGGCESARRSPAAKQTLPNKPSGSANSRQHIDTADAHGPHVTNEIIRAVRGADQPVMDSDMTRKA